MSQNQRLPLTEQTILKGGLREIGFLSEEINIMNMRLAEIAMEYKDIQLLMSIPGVGYYSALVIISEIRDIPRFPCAKKLAGYAGLAPRVCQPGNIKRYGRISKDGSQIAVFQFECILLCSL